jgi:dolichyl-phosphate-mannose-protein mannosyltransferase
LMFHMHGSNMAVRPDEGFQSRWWQLPWQTAGPMSYHYSENSRVYLQYEPFNLVACLLNWIGVVILWFIFALSNRNRNKGEEGLLWKGMTLVVGYLASLLPFALVPRILYLYHYIIRLMFAIALSGFTLEWLRLRFERFSWLIGVAFGMCSIRSFWKYRYWIYGLQFSNHESLMKGLRLIYICCWFCGHH